jgi:predicted dehydrogenase
VKAHPEDKPVRFALIGAGRIGQTHLEALSKCEGAALTALVEPRVTAAEPIAEQRKVRWFTDHEHPELLGMIDAAIIATPPNEHARVGRYLLEHGKHVLCEKPIALTVEDARSMTELARRKGALLMMASKFRYVDDIIKAKATIEAGILGRVIMYENTFAGKVQMKDRWNAVRAVSGGGVLIDNGTHSVDIARYLFGPITEVQAQNGIAAQGLEVEDTARLQFRTKSGVIGIIDLSWSINKETDGYVSVYGSEGTLMVGWTGSRYRQDGNSKWVPFGSGYDKVGSLRKQLDNFCATLRGTELPRITGDDALASVQVIEAAYASASRNNWLQVAGA